MEKWIIFVEKDLGLILNMNKKTVVINSNFSRLLTGFGRTSRTLLRYLYKTEKYNLVEAANALSFENDDTKKMPWTCHGTAPTPEEQHQIATIANPQEREARSRAAGYGFYGIDKIVEKYKPHAVILQEDYWGFFGFDQKKWFKQTNPVLWTTADSVPLQKEFVDMAQKMQNVYVWASFAERAFAAKGINHVKTLHGCIDPEPFFNVGEETRKNLRREFNIPEDCFVYGTCSRNQLRKGFPQLLESLKVLKIRNPEKNIKLLLHTSFQEGFDIPFLIQEHGLNPLDVLTTYFCPNCKKYEVKPFCGHDQKCRYCGHDKTNTVSIVNGVDDSQLNEIYNLFDAITHVANSGGLEYVCLEGKLCEIPLCTTSYSYGEDAVGEGTGGFALDWEPYTEIGSNFTKAATKISSIVEKTEWLLSLSKQERSDIGKQGRKYILDNYSINVIGKKWEQIIDNLPEPDWEKELPAKSPSYFPPQGLSPEDFMLDVFSNIMGENFDKNNTHVKFWTDHLVKSQDYNGVLKHFQNLAAQHNAQQQNKPVELTDLLDKDDEGKRAAIVMPESAGDIILINSLLKKFKALYPEYNLYFFTKPEFFDIVEHREEIHKVLAYSPQIDDMFALTGRWKHRGAFELAFFPANLSQKTMSYQNGPHECRAEWLNSDTMS